MKVKPLVIAVGTIAISAVFFLNKNYNSYLIVSKAEDVPMIVSLIERKPLTIPFNVDDLRDISKRCQNAGAYRDESRQVMELVLKDEVIAAFPGFKMKGLYTGFHENLPPSVLAYSAKTLLEPNDELKTNIENFGYKSEADRFLSGDYRALAFAAKQIKSLNSGIAADGPDIRVQAFAVCMATDFINGMLHEGRFTITSDLTATLHSGVKYSDEIYGTDYKSYSVGSYRVGSNRFQPYSED